MGSRARDKGFDVNISFVDREQQIFRAVLGGDGEAAWEIREDGIASELGRRLNAATENDIWKVFGVVVV
jgi:hypothetical protein